MLNLTSTRVSFKRIALLISVVACIAAHVSPAMAQSNPFADGWSLKQDSSSIRFQSIKKQTKVETSSFAILEGEVDETGLATVRVKLDSVDTKVDLRNVRMRFLFFETFQYPEAIASVKLEQSVMSELAQVRRKVMTVPLTLDLHGVKKTMDVEVALTMITDDVVSVTSSSPVIISIADFDLLSGLKKLEEAANVTVVPSTTVTFDLLFERGASETVAATAQPAAASAALETSGTFSEAECVGRLEILSRTDNIYFKSGSAILDPESRAILGTIQDIIQRCPDTGVEISGHTDSDGGAAGNQALSLGRANAVADYLVQNSVDRNRLTVRGYGEEKPKFPNDTVDNKRRNRRIEFRPIPL